MPVTVAAKQKQVKKLEKKVKLLKKQIKKQKKKPVKKKQARKGGGTAPKKKKKKQKGWSIGKKIGVGLGAAFGAAALGYGAVKAGKKVKQQKEGRKFASKIFESKFKKRSRETKTLGSWDPKKKRWTGK